MKEKRGCGHVTMEGEEGGQRQPRSKSPPRRSSCSSELHAVRRSKEAIDAHKAELASAEFFRSSSWRDLASITGTLNAVKPIYM